MGIKFFKKNILDLDNKLPVFSVNDSVGNSGFLFVDLMRNRDNTSGWMTTGSSDAGNTTMVINFGEAREFDRVLIVGTNIKSYTLKYWNGSSFVDFSAPIDVTDNDKSTILIEFGSLQEYQQLELVIRGTQVPNEDKYIQQLIFTEVLGEFSFQPEINPRFSRSRKSTEYISGKVMVTKSVGGFLCDVKFSSITGNQDLTLIEKLFNYYGGFLVWPCGGDISQYPTVREGYRLEDIFLMDLLNDYEPSWRDGHYKHGMPVNLKLAEVN